MRGHSKTYNGILNIVTHIKTTTREIRWFLAPRYVVVSLDEPVAEHTAFRDTLYSVLETRDTARLIMGLNIPTQRSCA